MSVKLSKIEVELWTNEDLDPTDKGKPLSSKYPYLENWQESDILPEYHNQELAAVLDDICQRSHYDTWSDFELHYTDMENGDQYFFSYNIDGKLMQISRNNMAHEDVTGKIGFGTIIRDIETIPRPVI